MVSETSVMGVLQSDSLGVSNRSGIFIKRFLFGFDLFLIEPAVAKDVSQEVDSVVELLFVESESVCAGLSADFACEASAEEVDLLLYLGLGSVAGSL